MSQRRKAGEWVRLAPCSGFVRDSDRLRAQIQPEPEENPEPCLLGCGDPECREWADLWTEPDPLHGGRRWPLYHVSECQMHDAEEP
jgi:hypothetical protein